MPQYTKTNEQTLSIFNVSPVNTFVVGKCNYFTKKKQLLPDCKNYNPIKKKTA